MTTLARRFVLPLRRVLALLALGVLGLLIFGTWYLQGHLGLQPCPMCIVQRYAFVGIAVVAALAACTPWRRVHVGAAALAALFALGGLLTAARQSWLQWYPPEFFSCGRDPFSMVNQIGLSAIIPKVFAGHGDCTAVDWTFLSLTIANWSFLMFAGIGLVLLLAVWRRAV